MFGYVKTFKPEMKYREYDQYRGVYCSLCRSLGKRYGLLPRMMLSYDLAFLAVFRMALDNSSISFRQGRCPFNPTKRCLYCDGEGSKEIDYAADVSVLLAYYKLEDTISDERFLKKWGALCLRLLMKKHFRRACARRNEEASWVWSYIQKQHALEEDTTSSVDAAAHPTAELLSLLAVNGFHEHSSAEEIRRFGYCLGRFVYLADAVEDVGEDVSKGRYNPYAVMFRKDNDACIKYMKESLYACGAVCAECYETLDIQRFEGILHNVVYWGIPSVIERISTGKREESLHEKSL